MTRRTYPVTARRVGDWWAFDVAGLDGAFGQVRRLTQISDAARDVIALLLGLDDAGADAVDVELTPELPPEIHAKILAYREARSQAEEAERRTRQAMEDVIIHLRGETMDLPIRDVGELLGLSHQRVHQLERQIAPRSERRTQRSSTGAERPSR